MPPFGEALFCAQFAETLRPAFVAGRFFFCENMGEVIEVSQFFQGYQQPMYQQPAYPTRLPQMQQPVYQQPAVQPQAAPVIQQTPMTLVTSREQAVVAQIPFDGLTYYFANTANGEVYSKRFDNNTGTSPLIVYRREAENPVAEYATIGMVQELAQIIQAMQEQIQAMAPKNKSTNTPKKEETA